MSELVWRENEKINDTRTALASSLAWSIQIELTNLFFTLFSFVTAIVVVMAKSYNIQNE